MVRLNVVIYIVVAVVTNWSQVTKAEDFHTKVINALYGTNHTGWPDECGRDWTYFHYIASELTAVIALEIVHIIFVIVACTKLWKKNGSILKI